MSYSCCCSSDDCRSLRMSQLSGADRLVPHCPLPGQLEHCSLLHQHHCSLKHAGSPLKTDIIHSINISYLTLTHVLYGTIPTNLPSGHPLWLAPPLWHHQVWPWITSAPWLVGLYPRGQGYSRSALWRCGPFPPIKRWSVHLSSVGALE